MVKVERKGVSLTTGIFLDEWLLASDLSMTHLLTVGTLYAGVISRLWALATSMSFSITVTANDLTLIGAVFRKVTLLT